MAAAHNCERRDRSLSVSKKVSSAAFGFLFTAALGGCATMESVSAERVKFCALPNETCLASCHAYGSRNVAVCNQRCDTSHYTCLMTGCFPFKTVGPQCETFQVDTPR